MTKEYLRVFRAFTDESRVRVLQLLSQGELCACILLEDLKISQPTLSHHMKILCASGIVKARQVGRWSYYSIDGEGCEYAARLLNAAAEGKMEELLRMALFFHRLLRPVRFLLHPEQRPKKEDAPDCCCLAKK